MIYTSDTKTTTRYRLVLDTETGGFDNKVHALLSIGYVVLSGKWRIVDKGEILVKSGKMAVTQGALDANKIDLVAHNKVALTEAKVIKALDKVLARYWRDTRRMKVIGQNVEFDLDFLKAMHTRHGKSFRHSWSIIDLKHFVRCLIELGLCNAANSKQDTMIDYMNIKTTGQRHSALADCLHLVAIFRKFRRLIPVI